MKFQCHESCKGKCCSGPEGFVFLTEEDLVRLEKHLGKKREEFADLGKFDSAFFTDEEEIISWYLNRPGKACFFLKDGKCTVYQARPTQCRTYPFWPALVSDKQAWHEERARCPGIGKGPHRDDGHRLLIEQKRADAMYKVDPGSVKELPGETIT